MNQNRTTILVSSRDGLFLIGRDGGESAVRGPLLNGHDVSHARRDPATGDLWAAATRGEQAAIWRSSDDGATWACPAGPLDAERAWHVFPTGRGTVWAGAQPAQLLRSDDGGATWQGVPGLNEHPSTVEWTPGGAGLILHTILHDPARPDRVIVAISSAGAFRSTDGGVTWDPANDGTTSFADMFKAFTGNDAEHPGVHRCVHKITPDPTNPDRYFMQSHDGMYRSDDGGATWIDISEGLPSRFGFGIAAAPHDGPAGSAVWVIPQSNETLRTVDGITVWRSLDGGASWTPQRNGLPCDGDYMILRDAMAADAGGVYAGSSDGTLWASRDAGETWRALATGLGRIQAVELG